MSSPQYPHRDLSLERLGDRDGQRSGYLGLAAQASSPMAGASSVSEFQAAYQALIDAVFTAPGAAEWLFGLRLAMATRFAGKDAPPRASGPRDAIRAAGPGCF